MGIRGLRTYINNNPEFMDYHELHGGCLIIDGSAVAANLFVSTGCNPFAGDLDKFSQRVSTFFDALCKCNVTPMVILDGGFEVKKMDTLAIRKKLQMNTIASYTPNAKTRSKIFSLAVGVVFEAVLREKEVKTVRCIFEADASIATVAKMLDCPVLSNDSDFYIFGVKYIPVESLAQCTASYSWGKRYVIRCKLFAPEFILRLFPDLDLSTLPLAAVLLGNDYTMRDTLERFFAGIELSSTSRRLYCLEQRRIDTVFRWLCKYNLEEATAAILAKMPKNRRKEMLCIIELVVSGYFALPCSILGPSGLSKVYRTKTTEWQKQKKFHFSGDIETLDGRKFWSEAQLAASEDSSSKKETERARPVFEPVSAIELVNTWPAWFEDHYHIGNLPAYFVNMMAYGMFDVAIQMENFRYPSAHSMSMKIVGVIHGLLVAGRPDDSARGLTYTIRDGRDLKVRYMDTVERTRTINFPALSDLFYKSMRVRKRIFDDTMEISGLEALIEDVPVEWRLYVIAIVYWMRQPDQPPRNSCHMHAVLFAMLSSVVDQKIGMYRSMKLFDNCYREAFMKLKSNRQVEKSDEADKELKSIVEALKFVRPGDCLLAAPIFIKLSAIDEEFYENPQKFNVTIVHVFAQFLSCVTEALHLNSLLGYPYEPLNIGDYFNGTMLYNLFAGFEKLSDVEAYNYKTLEESPSIGNLLKLLTVKVKEVIAQASLGDCGSTDARKLSEDEPSKQVLPEETSAARPPPIDLQDPFSTPCQKSSKMRNFASWVWAACLCLCLWMIQGWFEDS